MFSFFGTDGLKVIVAVNINRPITAFFYRISCGLIEGYQRFGRVSCLRLQCSVKDLSTKHCFSPLKIMIFTLKCLLYFAVRCENDFYKCSEMQLCKLTKGVSGLFCPQTYGFGSAMNSMRFNIEFPRPTLCVLSSPFDGC